MTVTDFHRERDDELYVVSSFNDWMPMRMKTALMLRLERYPLNYDVSDIPQ